jgi:hypothetical protein
MNSIVIGGILMPLKLEELVLSYRNYYGTYHDHKEQMAFSATTIYLAGATAVIVQAESISNWLVPKEKLIFLLTSTFIIAFWFVIAQFCKRDTAADIAQACTTLATHLLTWSPCGQDYILKCYKGINFPSALTEELKTIRANRSKQHIFKRWLSGTGLSALLSYLVMAAWSVSAAFSLYCAYRKLPVQPCLPFPFG